MGTAAVGKGNSMMARGTAALIRGSCCYLQELKCLDGSPTGKWAKTTSFDLTKIYDAGGSTKCVYYGGVASPCLPSGATERTSAPGTSYDDCTACGGGWLQIYDCDTSAALSIAGHTYWIEAYKISDASKIWKQGSGSSAKCYYFPNAPQASPGDTGRLEGTLAGPFATCDTCKNRTSCGSGKQLDVSFLGITQCCGQFDASSSYRFTGTVNATFRVPWVTNSGSLCIFDLAGITSTQRLVHSPAMDCTGAVIITSNSEVSVLINTGTNVWTVQFIVGGGSDRREMIFSGSGTGTVSGGKFVPPASFTNSPNTSCGQTITTNQTTAAGGGTAVVQVV